MSWFKSFGLVCALLVLGACGFQPLYGGGTGSVVRSQLGAIEISPIDDRVGQQLRNELLIRINPQGTPRDPAYTLGVELTVGKEELAIKKSEIATRANLRLTANFRLTQKAGGAELTTGTSRIITSYNILSSDFATLAAEADAERRGVRELADEISNRVAAFLQLAKRG